MAAKPRAVASLQEMLRNIAAIPGIKQQALWTCSPWDESSWDFTANGRPTGKDE